MQMLLLREMAIGHGTAKLSAYVVNDCIDLPERLLHHRNGCCVFDAIQECVRTARNDTGNAGS
jgi:hypothetical protein